MEATKTKSDWQVKFERFWASWPARVTPTGRSVKLGVVAAETWFRIYKPDDALFARIMAAVDSYTKCQDAHYYKDAFRWLGKKMWMDQYEVKPKKHEMVFRCIRCDRSRRESEMVYVKHLGRCCKEPCR